MIGEGTFAGCNNLSSVTIGENVETIGSRAFMSCEKLTSVVIPNSVTTIQSLQSAGINSVAENTGVTVQAVDGSIVVNGYDGAAIVEVFGIGGNRVYSGHDAAITDLAPGVYVVRIGNSTTKVML